MSPDGEKLSIENDLENISIFFQELNYGKYMPRAILIDSEPSVIGKMRYSFSSNCFTFLDEIKNGPYRNLYSTDNMISGCEDSANNFARGFFLGGSKVITPFKNCLTRLVEQVDNVEGFFIINSMSGGTGGGLGTLILQEISTDYPKISRVQLTIFPSPTMTNAIVEPYNATLHSHSTMEACELAILFDNEALYDLCHKLLFINSPTYTNLNRLLSLMINSTTASMRFSNTLNSGLKEIHTNLIPYPRVHHAMLRYAPIDHNSTTPYTNPTVAQITKQVLSKDYQALRCDCNRGKFISIILNYRGLVTPNEIAIAINKYRTNTGIKFVDWSPTGFKIGINDQNPSYMPESLIGYSDKSVTMLANTTALASTWANLTRKFDLLYAKKSFVFWFTNEGLEESELVDSREDLAVLQNDYLEITLNDQQIADQQVVKKPSKPDSE